MHTVSPPPGLIIPLRRLSRHLTSLQDVDRILNGIFRVLLPANLPDRVSSHLTFGKVYVKANFGVYLGMQAEY